MPAGAREFPGRDFVEKSVKSRSSRIDGTPGQSQRRCSLIIRRQSGTRGVLVGSTRPDGFPHRPRPQRRLSASSQHPGANRTHSPAPNEPKIRRAERTQTRCAERTQGSFLLDQQRWATLPEFPALAEPGAPERSPSVHGAFTQRSRSVHRAFTERSSSGHLTFWTCSRRVSRIVLNPLRIPYLRCTG
jgi:hypothetical protein